MRKIEGSEAEGGFRVINLETDTVEYENKECWKCLMYMRRTMTDKKARNGRKSKDR